MRRNHNVRKLMTTLVIWVTIYLSLGSWSVADERIPANPPARYWKGNIHTHSLWSDGNDFPEMIAEWYRTHDYNFLALTDHNVLSAGQRWMKLSAITSRNGATALPKYRARFGDAWVETRGEGAAQEVRLKPLNEFRSLLEERGKFIMMQGEEISDRAEGVPVHMNATNIKLLLQPLSGATVREAMTNNLRAVAEQAEREGREVMLHLNHPNFGYAITAEDLAHVVTEQFFEVYNGHPGVNQLGNASHASLERIWDIANTIRVGQLNAPPLFGVATDDSHKYHGKPGSRPGRGWVMVRSTHLTPEFMVRAMKRGDFYASSGVSLEAVEFDPQSKRLQLRIQAVPGVTYKTRFIGTRIGYDPKSEPHLGKDGKALRVTRKYSTDVGAVLAETTGNTPAFTLQGDELYVRAVIISSQAHPDPSHAGQFQQAWTQPFGWRAKLK